MKRCRHCGKPFRRLSTQALYCKTQCRTQYHWIRKVLRESATKVA